MDIWLFGQKREQHVFGIIGINTWSNTEHLQVNTKKIWTSDWPHSFSWSWILQERSTKMDRETPSARCKLGGHPGRRLQLEKVRPEGHPRRQVSQVNPQPSTPKTWRCRLISYVQHVYNVRPLFWWIVSHEKFCTNFVAKQFDSCDRSLWFR